MSPCPRPTNVENAVLALMRARFDHVSAERLLSGPGLVNSTMRCARSTAPRPRR